MWLTFTKGKCCSKNWVVFFSGNYLPIPTTWPLVCNWWPPVQIQLSVSEPLLPCILLTTPAGGAGRRARACPSPSCWGSMCRSWWRDGGSSTASCPGQTPSPSISRCDYVNSIKKIIMKIKSIVSCKSLIHNLHALWTANSGTLCKRLCCQGLVIGTLGQKRVIARVVRRTVMRDCPVTVTLTCPLAIRWGGLMVRSGPLGSRAVHEPLAKFSQSQRRLLLSHWRHY